MANPNFAPTFSTDEVYRGENLNRCLTDDLDAIEADVSALETGKAAANHTHSGYAAAEHEHSEYAAASHEHSSYAATGHAHSEYAAAAHEHSNYANADHAHADYAMTAHEHTGYAAAEHTHTGFAAENHIHNEYAAAEHDHAVFSGASASTYKLVYVGPEGNDENTGFSTSAPMATIKGVIRKYSDMYKMLDIRLLDGTYNEDIGAIAVDVPNLSIRSATENKDAVIINMANQIDLNSGLVRLYNMTLNVTANGTRGISVNSGALYAYGVRINVPEASTTSCINVYNGTQAFLMNCVLNAGTADNSGAAVYGNQALLIKAINCTSERTNNVGFHAHNGSDIWYTNTITAATVAKTTSWGKCTVR